MKKNRVSRFLILAYKLQIWGEAWSWSCAREGLTTLLLNFNDSLFSYCCLLCCCCLKVHEELLAAIKDAEEGLLHLKRSRLLKQVDEIFPDEASISQSPEVAIEPLDPDDVETEPLESRDFSVGSKCRFRHNNGRWYNGCIIGFEGSSDARISFLTPTSENMSVSYLI